MLQLKFAMEIHTALFYKNASPGLYGVHHTCKPSTKRALSLSGLVTLATIMKSVFVTDTFKIFKI